MERMQKYRMSIKFSKEKMLSMDKMIEDFLEENNIILSFPVDVFALATSLGFDVRGAELRNNLDGLLIVNENEDKIENFNSNKIIAYNCRNDIQMKKFTVAHELAHYIFAKSQKQNERIVLATREHKDEYSYDENEQMMDYMAAGILVPRSDLLTFSKENDLKEQDFNRCIMDRYNVNSIISQRRIEEVLND